MTDDSASLSLLGIRIGLQPVDELVHACLAAMDGDRPSVSLACANPHSLVVAQSDEAFRRSLDAATFVVADGVGITLASRLVAGREIPRVTGSDVFAAAMAALDRRGGRVFFLGSTPGTLENISRRCAHDYPNVSLVGRISPPFGAWSAAENAAILAAINDARPDLLWVGMTAPRQEKWVADNMARLDVPVVGSIGAVFDYYAGNVRRAPEWLRSSGLEWLYRLAHEPQRLWRRTMISGPRFVRLVLQEHFASQRPVGLRA